VDDALDSLFSLCLGDALLVHTRGLDRVWTIPIGGVAWTAQPVPPVDLARARAPVGVAASILPPVSFLNEAWTGAVAVWWNWPRDVAAAVELGQHPQTFHFPGNGLTFDPVSAVWKRVAAGPETFGTDAVAWSDGYALGFAPVAGRPESDLVTYFPR
jgi:hypothetical protein